MKRRQFWFRPDEIELLVACLKHARSAVKSTPYLNDGHRMAAAFTANRIDEVVDRLEEKREDS